MLNCQRVREVQMVENLPAMQETWVQSLGWEDPLEKGMATHFSIRAWRIPWTEALMGYSQWGCKESDTIERLTLSIFKGRFGKPLALQLVPIQFLVMDALMVIVPFQVIVYFPI